MADTKTLEELNKDIVKLVDELSSMQAKQERLRELMRERSELEDKMLGMPGQTAQRGPGRRRANGQDRPADKATAAAG
jgi:predicted nuclease with TOPRIM domain